VPCGELTERARSRIREWKAAGWSQYKIIKETKLKPTTVKRILKAESSRRSRKGKQYRPYLLSFRDINRIIRYITKTYTGRELSYDQIKSELYLKPSANTIRRALRKVRFRCCIACPPLFISKLAAKKRLAFAKKYRWWGTSDYAAAKYSDWRKVIWSDECIFETGKIRRVWVTRRPGEKHCETCLKSVYRSGRTLLMI
jgi:hypothetical protein